MEWQTGERVVRVAGGMKLGQPIPYDTAYEAGRMRH